MPLPGARAATRETSRQAGGARRLGDDRPEGEDNPRAHAFEGDRRERERDEHNPLPPAASRNEMQGANQVTQLVSARRSVAGSLESWPPSMSGGAVAAKAPVPEPESASLLGSE